MYNATKFQKKEASRLFLKFLLLLRLKSVATFISIVFKVYQFRFKGVGCTFEINFLRYKIQYYSCSAIFRINS